MLTAVRTTANGRHRGLRPDSLGRWLQDVRMRARLFCLR